MSTPDLIKRLTTALRVQLDGVALHQELLAEADAALAAQPEGEGPSAADLLPANPPNIPTTMAMQYRSAWREGVEDGWNEARAALARWGRPTAPPAPEVGEVEVKELVAALKEPGDPFPEYRTITSEQADRIAALLQQQQHLLGLACAELDRMGAFSAAPAPAVVTVAVSERLPESRLESEGGDCDAEGRCWWFSPPACGPHKIRPCWTLDSEAMEGDTHWRPFHAIPLPQAGEVEA